MEENEMEPFLRTFLATVGYTVFGLIVFAICFWMIIKITPFSVRKEIEEDQNTSLAILIAAVLLGIAIIIAATIHG
jgi:putative membrane protein